MKNKMILAVYHKGIDGDIDRMKELNESLSKAGVATEVDYDDYLGRWAIHIDMHDRAKAMKALTANETTTEKFNAKEYITKHSDFKKYYDKTQKRNIWVLGYFGGGAVNISEAMELAREYSRSTGASLGEVKIDEVLSSRRFKGFKYIYADTEQKPEEGTERMDNVHAWLRD